ncbi:MAG TPA: hypothetical protein P5130_13725 [Spirochaetota bacterium]|nr:hypothetical protein [Spirochaetota bacterium]
MAVCSPATECAFHPWKATGSIRQPGRDARRIGMRVHETPFSLVKTKGVSGL